MKKFNILSVMVVSAFSLCLFATHSHAKSKSEGSNFLVEVGIMEMEKGQIEQAVHEFSKALLLDPTNKEAKKHLRELGYDGGLYKGPQTNFSDMTTAHQKLKDHEKNLAKLSRQKYDVQEKLAALQEEQEFLHEVIRQKDEVIALLTKRLNQAENISTVQKTQMNMEIEDIYTQPVRSGDPVVIYEKAEPVMYPPAVYYDEFKAFEEYAYDQYQHQDKIIRVMHDYLKLREDDLEDTKNALISKEIDLATTQLMLSDRVDELLRLNESQHKHFQ